MSQKELKLKNSEFLAFKGDILEVDEEKNYINASLDLDETFENPPQEKIEVQINILEETKISEIRITIEGGEVVEGSEDTQEEEIEMSDLEKHQELLVSPSDPDDVRQILSEQAFDAQDIIIFKNGE